MELTADEKEMLRGKHGNAVRKSMEILQALGEIYGAKRMVDVASVQIAGVSYDNLGEAGLEFLDDMAKDGRVKVLTTLNPAGMDLENWQTLGIDPEFAKNQGRVIDAFTKMGVIATCTCTPYLIGNVPHYGEHIAWSESSAVCYANSVLAARTNREGGPSALAAALTGKTPEYGLHLDQNREAEVHVKVQAALEGTHTFSALGKVIGDKIKSKIPLITGVEKASVEELKALCASIATYGGTALFHMKGITPEAQQTPTPSQAVDVTDEDVEKAIKELTDEAADVDFVSIGCPHCSIKEIGKIAELLKGKKVKKEVWITTARPTKRIADQTGYTKTIEDAGVKFACDTCCVVAPIKGRFKTLCTDSAKGCFYARAKNKFQTRLESLEDCIAEALR